MVGVDDDVLSTELSHSELFSADTSKADSFPDLGDVSLLGGIVSGLVLLEHNVSLSELVVVVDSLEEDLSRQVKFAVEASFSTGEDVSLVGLGHERLKLSKEAFSTHGVGKDKLRVNSLLFLELAGHQQVSDDLLVVVLLGGEVDNSIEVVSILSLDEGIDGLVEVAKVKLRLGEFKPYLLLVGLISKLSGKLDIFKVVK